MDTTMNILWDTVLNSIGYLAAGVLSVILYAMVRKRMADETQATTKTKTEDNELPNTEIPIKAKKESEGPRFVTFKSAPNQKDRITDYRRDRIQVIGQAREMILAGESFDNIRRSLPISEAELALLSYESK